MSRPLPHRGRSALLISAALALLIALLARPAGAELTQHGNLFIRFDGGIAPRALPRHEPAPISVRVEGTVRVPTGDRPPALREIEIAVNRAGKLDARGLPTCPRGRIESVEPSEALRRCGPALVGSGGVVAKSSLTDQAATTLRIELLLFNGIYRGRQAIFAHAYQSQPIPITRVFVFEIRRQAGTFGTVITGRTPASLNADGYVKSIFLQLERRYTYRGQRRSYLNAACSAAPGFTVGTFPFAKASMSFEDGRSLSSTLVRSCAVR